MNDAAGRWWWWSSYVLLVVDEDIVPAWLFVVPLVARWWRALLCRSPLLYKQLLAALLHRCGPPLPPALSSALTQRAPLRWHIPQALIDCPAQPSKPRAAPAPAPGPRLRPPHRHAAPPRLPSGCAARRRPLSAATAPRPHARTQRHPLLGPQAHLRRPGHRPHPPRSDKGHPRGVRRAVRHRLVVGVELFAIWERGLEVWLGAHPPPLCGAVRHNFDDARLRRGRGLREGREVAGLATG